MYQDAADALSNELVGMRLMLSKEVAAAARQAQGKLKKDILRVISLSGVGETSTKSMPTAELRRLVKNSLAAMDEAWAKELQNPTTDLRARNPFAVLAPNHAPSEDSEDEGDSDDSDVSSEASESESSEDEDSDDGDYEE